MLAYTTKQAIEEESFDEFGKLLDQGWNLKRKLNPDTTNTGIDDMYQQAKGAGALGGKVVGAGGGGFMLLYVPMNKRSAVRASMAHLEELPFHFAEVGSKVIFNYRK